MDTHQQKIFVRHGGASCVIVASMPPRCLPRVSWCLLMSHGVIGASSFPPGDAARYAPDLPRLHRIHPILNNHFLGFFPDTRRLKTYLEVLCLRPCFFYSLVSTLMAAKEGGDRVLNLLNYPFSVGRKPSSQDSRVLPWRDNSKSLSRETWE